MWLTRRFRRRRRLWRRLLLRRNSGWERVATYVTRDSDSGDSEREEDEHELLGEEECPWVSVVDLELATVLGSDELWKRMLGNSSKPIGITSTMR